MEAIVIDKAKQYTTRDGRPVRIYATDHVGEYPVHGAVQGEDGWTDESWKLNGRYFDTEEHHEGDLIESRPQHTRWFALTGVSCGFSTREEAVEYAMKYLDDDAAVVQVTWRDGDGL